MTCWNVALSPTHSRAKAVKQRASGIAHPFNVKMRLLTVSRFPLNSVSLGTPKLSKDPSNLFVHL